MKKLLFLVVILIIGLLGIYLFRAIDSESNLDTPVSNSKTTVPVDTSPSKNTLQKLNVLYESLAQQPNNFVFPGCALVHGDDSAAEKWQEADQLSLDAIYTFYTELDKNHELIRVGNEMWILTCSCDDLAKTQARAIELKTEFPWVVFHWKDYEKNRFSLAEEPMYQCFPKGEN